MLLHTLRCAEPGERDRAVQILRGAVRASTANWGPRCAAGRARDPGRALGRAGRDRGSAARIRHIGVEESRRIRWLYELVHRVGSTEHARQIGRWHARKAALQLAGLDWFPASRHRDVLCGLVDYVHRRTR